MPSLTDTAAHRVHSLDGLRGIASALVVVHHLGLPGLAAALEARHLNLLAFIAGSIGASGVELFFVLSGLVLTRPYAFGNRPFSVGQYAVRRVKRLFPPYILSWLLAGLAIYVVATFPTWWSHLAGLPAFDFVDWLLQIGILYFGPTHYSFAWWSLGVEVMFYLVVPVLLVARMKVPSSTLGSLALLGLVCGLSWLAPHWFPGAKQTPGDVGMFAYYAPCFLVGLLLARVQWPAPVAYALGTVGAACLLLSHAWPGLHAHVGYCLLYAAVVSRSLDPTSAFSRILGNWHLVWLGERSYSLFLVHAPLIILAYYAASLLTGGSGSSFVLLSRLIAIPLSLVVTLLSFHWIERRFAHGLVTGESFWPLRSRERPAAITAERPAVG